MVMDKEELRRARLEWELYRTNLNLSRGDGISPAKRERCLAQKRKLEEKIKEITTTNASNLLGDCLNLQNFVAKPLGHASWD